MLQDITQKLREVAQEAAKVREKKDRIPACMEAVLTVPRYADCVTKRTVADGREYDLTIAGETITFPKAADARDAYRACRTAIRPAVKALAHDAESVSAWVREHNTTTGVGAYLRFPKA